MQKSIEKRFIVSPALETPGEAKQGSVEIGVASRDAFSVRECVPSAPAPIGTPLV